MKNIIIYSHGSRYQKTIDEIQKTIEQIKSEEKGIKIKYAFLEIQNPTLEEAVEEYIKEGETEIIILLNFLNAGRHTDKDIPNKVKDIKEKYKQIKIKITKSLSQVEGYISLLKEAIKNNE